MRETLRGYRSGPLWALILGALILEICALFMGFDSIWTLSIVTVLLIPTSFGIYTLLKTRSENSSTQPKSIDIDPDDSNIIENSPTIQKQIVELPIRRDIERLATFIQTPGHNKCLLTGYESFGGTSLVLGAIRKIQYKIKRQNRAATHLLIFRFNVVENDEIFGKFNVEVNDIRLGKLHAESTNTLSLDLEDIEEITPEISLTTPLQASFLGKLTQKLVQEQRNPNFNVDLLLSGLAQLFGNNFKKSRLQEELCQRLSNSTLPINAVIILDRIDQLETLKTLTQYALFNNLNVSTIAVARKEYFDRWQDAERQLKKIGFESWYIPCLWHVERNYVEQIVEAMFDVYDTPMIDPAILRKHFEFIGRGVLGNLLAELRKNLLSDDARGRIMEVLRPRSDIEHNAWRQMVLDKNWSLILGGWFAGSQQIDKGRIGVYHLLQWIDEKAIFTLSDLLDEAIQPASFSIHPNSTIATDVAWNLLEVLRQHQYITKKENAYRRIWQEDNLPEIRIITEISPMPSPTTEENMSAVPPYHAEISLMPGQPQVGQSIQLSITLSRSANVNWDSMPSKIVYVYVSSESSDIKPNVRIKAIPITTSAESARVEFTLVPQIPGEKQISVDLFQDTQYSGRQTLSFLVTESPQISSTTNIHTKFDVADEQSRLGPDISILVSGQRFSDGTHCYQYMVITRNKEQSSHNFFVTQQIHPEPHKIYQEIFKNLDTFDGKEDDLEGIGTKLYKDLIPQSLQKLLWDEFYVSRTNDEIPSVQIVSKDTWLPWELMRLNNPNTGNDGEFLCERCNLTRCLTEISFPKKLRIKTKGLIADKRRGSLPSAQSEIDHIKELFAEKARNIELHEIPFGEAEVKKAFKVGGYSAFHFICHGRYNAINPDDSTIFLQDAEIRPSYINGDRSQCRKDKPFVFMNVCGTGQSDRALTGMGGWAEAFLREANSCGFIGSIWGIRDDVASIFSFEFYKNLLDGKTVGESVRLARRAIKEAGDSSWLSYTVYADPMARLDLE